VLGICKSISTAILHIRLYLGSSRKAIYLPNITSCCSEEENISDGVDLLVPLVPADKRHENNLLSQRRRFLMV
jgi:hypothetical protein